MPLHLASIVNETSNLLYSDAKEHGLGIVTNSEADLPQVFGDPILIEQMLVNLVRNGLESMSANPARRSDELIITLSARGRHQAIEVIDNGTGIDPAIAERLFEAFTSSKPQGMGIGLNICRSIIELHKGSLRHRPNPQGGTVFTIELPAASQAGEANGGESRSEVKGVVHIVDDEEAIRKLIGLADGVASDRLSKMGNGIGLSFGTALGLPRLHHSGCQDAGSQRT